MPELPEVETMCRGIAAIVGRKIRAVELPPCKCRPVRITPQFEEIAERLENQLVQRVSRLGKRVLIHTSTDALILQPKMTGLVLVDDPPGHEHLRLRIEFTGRPQLTLLFWDRRGLGTIELISNEEIQSRIIDGKLGPDALAIPLEQFIERIKKTSRPIKVALLDQKIVAGVGNLYASEMLHLSGIHPARAASKLSKKRLTVLYENMLSILNLAIEHEGSTLSDGTYRNALNDPGSYQNQHQAYDRAGLNCNLCGDGRIKRIVQAQRSTFYCPSCQK